MVIVGGPITKVRAFDAGPVGLVTVIETSPAAVTSSAEIDAVTCDELTKVVVRLVPFHCTVAGETKPTPLTVSMNGPLPGRTVTGESEVSVGPDGANTVKLNG